MKKLLLGVLSLAAISFTAVDANAWFLPCCRDHCCNKCTTTLTCRPYNAFTPCCCGNISGNCCMPINMGCGGCGGYGGGCGNCCGMQQRAPSCFNGCPSYGPGCCTSGNCCDFGCLPAPGSFASVPQMPGSFVTGPQGPMPLQIPGNPAQTVPTAPGPQFVGPNPQIMNPMSYMVPMQPMQMPMQQLPMQMQPTYGYTPVQPIAYYPGYQQPMYNPYAYQAAPGYWYGR